jgi:hypothetical protein
MQENRRVPLELNAPDLNFLAEITSAAIEAARVRPGQRTLSQRNRAEGETNSRGFTLIRPGGRDCYPAVWPEDFTFAFATGFVTAEEGLNHLRLIAERQNGPEERRLKSGAIIPPFAVPDHINFDGSPVFFPGTYSPGEDQGGEPWGIYPALNNQFDFTRLAFLLWERTGSADFLRQPIGGLPLMERLRRAFAEPDVNVQTGMAETSAERRAVGFLFHDAVYMTGQMLISSIVGWRAAMQIRAMELAVGTREAARAYERQAELIARNLVPVFRSPHTHGGWLKASTGVSGQADVWGTLYALDLGLLPPEVAAEAVKQVLSDLERGTIEFEGALRQVPLDRDASATTMWDRAVPEHNRYQNGAFWHTPTGWLISALAEPSPETARSVFKAYVRHLRAESFLQGEALGAPWECIGWDGAAKQNPVFLGSVTIPCEAISRVARPVNVKG